MKVRSVAAATAISLLPIVGVATPAYANDATLAIDNPDTAVSPDARAHWDDLTDTLCVKARSGYYYSVAWFKRPSGKKVVVRDYPGGGNKCTGNLSIREGYATTLHLGYLETVFFGKKKKVRFHT